MTIDIKTEEIPVCLSEEDKEVWCPFTKDGQDYVIVRLVYDDVKKDYTIIVRTNHPQGKTTLFKFGFTDDQKFAKMVFTETCDILMNTEDMEILVEEYGFEW